VVKNRGICGCLACFLLRIMLMKALKTNIMISNGVNLPPVWASLAKGGWLVPNGETQVEFLQDPEVLLNAERRLPRKDSHGIP